MLRKIVSGRQTGADRAGLDFAIETSILPSSVTQIITCASECVYIQSNSPLPEMVFVSEKFANQRFKNACGKIAADLIDVSSKGIIGSRCRFHSSIRWLLGNGTTNAPDTFRSSRVDNSGYE